MSSAQIQLLKIALDARLQRARRDEAGASAVEWVVITAFLVMIVGVIAAIILEKLRSKAEMINP